VGISAAVLAGVVPGMLAGEPAGIAPAPPARGRGWLLVALLRRVAGLQVLDGSRGIGLLGAARRSEREGDAGKWYFASLDAVKADPSSAAARRSRSGAILARYADSPDLATRAMEALREADRAVDLEPFNYHGHRARATALLALGRVDEAVAAFDRARSRAGGVGHLHFAVGKALLLLSGERPALRGRAIDALRTAGECEPRYFTMAWKAIREAGVPLPEAAAIVPDRSFALRHWASVCSGAGDHGEAFRVLVRLWALDRSERTRTALLEAARRAGREEEEEAAALLR
jgi:hypothetical protein